MSSFSGMNVEFAIVPLVSGNKRGHHMALLSLPLLPILESIQTWKWLFPLGQRRGSY